MTKTGWYTGDQKPVRVGVYERNYGDNIPAYSLWDGHEWMTYADSVYESLTKLRVSSCVQEEPWRGITKGSK